MASPDRFAPVEFHGEASCGTAPGEVACGTMAVYLYALIDGAAALIEPGIDAFGESGKLIQPILHRAGSIAALIGMVPLSEYCGAEAAHHLKDLAWLAPRTMQHCRGVASGDAGVAHLPGALCHPLCQPRQPELVHAGACAHAR